MENANFRLFAVNGKWKRKTETENGSLFYLVDKP